MRQFKLSISWQPSNHIDEIYYVFAPEHTKTLSADDFYTLFQSNTSKLLTECSSKMYDFLINFILDEDYIEVMGIGTFASIEEV
jgi:hypothetical protein